MKRQIEIGVAVLFFALFVFSAPLYAAKLLFVYYSTYAPFGWDDNGEMKGIYIDVVNKVIVEKMGLEIEHKALPWKRAQDMVKRGEADGLCTVATPARLEYSDMTTETLIEANFKIFTSADNPRLASLRTVRSIPELKPYKLVDIRAAVGPNQIWPLLAWTSIG